jgi:hypothetical protein
VWCARNLPPDPELKPVPTPLITPSVINNVKVEVNPEITSTSAPTIESKSEAVSIPIITTEASSNVTSTVSVTANSWNAIAFFQQHKIEPAFWIVQLISLAITIGGGLLVAWIGYSLGWT